MSVSITELRVQNYGCVQSLQLDALGRLHAFIGPNDSGKSTILRALRTACHAFFHQWESKDVPFDPQLTAPYQLHLLGTGAELHLTRSESGPSIAWGKWAGQSFRTDNWRTTERLEHAGRVPVADRANFGSPPLMIRFDADSLRTASELIPDGRSVQYRNERGAGLAGVYDAIRNRGDEAFSEIATSIRKLFPTVRYVGLRNASNTTKELQLELIDGTKVPAAGLSEGLLLYLAFAALPYLAGEPPVLLVEEPENGLHPARIKDVVRVLREVSKTTQVFMATHSPLVVNELRPEEVFVTTRSPDEGTKVTRLDRTPNFEKRSSVYQNGELWIAYADGEQESALLGAGE